MTGSSSVSEDFKMKKLILLELEISEELNIETGLTKEIEINIKELWEKK